MADRPPGPELKPTPPTDRETRRFAAISLLRLSGAALVVIGLIVLNGRFGMPAAAGYGLVVIGLLEVFVGPQVLARRWRTPPE